MRGCALFYLLVVCALAAACAAAPSSCAEPGTASISGRTVDADTGASLAGVSLSAYFVNPRGIPTGNHTTSDSDGQFQMSVSAGELELHYSTQSPIYDEDVKPLPRFDVPETGLSGLVIKVPRRQVLIGWVRSAGGASVTVGPPGRNMGAITDRDGRFVLILPSRRKCSPG